MWFREKFANFSKVTKSLKTLRASQTTTAARLKAMRLLLFCKSAISSVSSDLTNLPTR
jgi:hypothetical protein